MISYEDKVLQKVLKQFDGMTKIEAFDVLHKIEVLLNGQQSPIQYEYLKMTLDKQFLQNAVLPVGNQGYCFLSDYCQYLKVYEFKPTIPINILGSSWYYSLSNKQELIPLTNQNVKSTFSDTHLKYIIQQFLKDNNVQKRNSKTKRLLLLELLDQVDPQRN